MKSVIFRLSSILFALFLTNCQSSEDENDNQPGTAVFVVSPDYVSGRVNNTEIPFSIMVTITTESGTPVETQKLITVTESDQGYQTLPITLPNGRYLLSEFIVLDEETNILFASPKPGSLLADLIEHTVPIAFEITSDNRVEVMPEIVKVLDSHTIDEYGYGAFSFNVVGAHKLRVRLSSGSTSIPGTVVVHGKDATGTAKWTSQVELTEGENQIYIRGGFHHYTFTFSAEHHELKEILCTSLPELNEIHCNLELQEIPKLQGTLFQIGQFGTQAEITYDIFDRMIRRVATYLPTGVVTTEEYFYNPQGNCDRHTSVADGITAETLFSWQEGRIVSTIRKENGIKKNESELTYNEQGQLESRVFFAFSSGQKKSSSKLTFAYHPDGNLFQLSEYLAKNDGSGFRLTNVTTYADYLTVDNPDLHDLGFPIVYQTRLYEFRMLESTDTGELPGIQQEFNYDHEFNDDGTLQTKRINRPDPGEDVTITYDYH